MCFFLDASARCWILASCCLRLRNFSAFFLTNFFYQGAELLLSPPCVVVGCSAKIATNAVSSFHHKMNARIYRLKFFATNNMLSTVIASPCDFAGPAFHIGDTPGKVSLRWTRCPRHCFRALIFSLQTLCTSHHPRGIDNCCDMIG